MNSNNTVFTVTDYKYKLTHIQTSTLIYDDREYINLVMMITRKRLEGERLEYQIINP